MTKQDKDEAKRILALLVDAAEHDQTPEEAEAELVADGVNVTGFLARVHQAVQEKQKAMQKEERLSWRKEARRNADLFSETEDMTAQYMAICAGLFILLLTPFATNAAIVLGGVWIAAIGIVHVGIALRSSK